MSYIIGIDTGGTFTDVTIISEKGDIWFDKANTTPHDFAVGVMDALNMAAQQLGIPIQELLKKTSFIKHGTTVATNALITRHGSKVGLITTRGFEDTTLIMRAIGRVAGLSNEEIRYQARVTKPVPLVPTERIKGVTERIDRQGNIIVPINIKEAKEVIRSLVEEHQVDSIAINFLWSFVNPVHEEKVKVLIREMYPDSNISLSFAHEVCPVIREYQRSNTVIINSFLDKTVNRYIDGLETRLKANGFMGPLLIMQANGGVVHRENMFAIGTVNSGPCGGMIASKYIAELLGDQDVITSDMGGTSFDVGLLVDGRWRQQQEPCLERFHISWPMIDVQSIGAGGGTIAWIDNITGELKLGPQSAGAVPGPACYDEQGIEPTITDANLVLGLLNADYFLGGRKRLVLHRAKQALQEKIAGPLGIDIMETAAGIHQMINSHMADLVRQQIVTTGKAPEDFVLYTFGGAGSLHAAGYAAELGIKRVRIFPTSAVFSAFGAAVADIMHTLTLSYACFMPVESHELNMKLMDTEQQLYDVMSKDGIPRDQVLVQRTFYMRYRKQLNEIDVLVPFKRYNAQDITNIMTLFEKRYEDVYGEGTAYSEVGIELVSIRVDAMAPLAKPVLKETQRGEKIVSDNAIKGKRLVRFPEQKDLMQVNIYDYSYLVYGNILNGPAIVEAPTTTIAIPHNVVCTVNRFLDLELDLEDGLIRQL